VTELLKQAQYSPLSISLMAATLFAVNKGFMDDVDVKKVLPSSTACTSLPEGQARCAAGQAGTDKAMDKDAEAELTAAIAAFKKNFA
jgi:F-type H+-transporting ATPase subunit alpha